MGSEGGDEGCRWGDECWRVLRRGMSCESVQCAHVQVVVISGRPENVEAAKEKVQEMVRARLEGGQSQTVVLPVPHHAVGRIIGRGGANIRCLQRESGAKVRPMSVHVACCVMWSCVVS